MPPTCGRISAASGARVRPSSSVVMATDSAATVCTPTAVGRAAAGGAALWLSPQADRTAASAAAVSVAAARERHCCDMGSGCSDIDAPQHAQQMWKNFGDPRPPVFLPGEVPRPGIVEAA